MKGVVLAGTRSGVGKTVATLATLRALDDAGRDPRPAKAGPDFIDPSHHERVAGRPSRTLDPWLQGADGLRRSYWRGAEGGGDPVCVVEGVMGLYDGDVASTAAVAEALSLPVVLVVDATAGMESVAATALGFRAYADRIGRDVDVAGVVAQRAHGGRHADGIREALPAGITYCGRLPPDDDLAIPERHLGLHTDDAAAVPEAALDRAAETLRTQRLLDLAREPPAADSGDDPPAGGRVAVASDAAFAFRYPATVERLRAGGSVESFSPVAGDSLPDCDAVYLPGGYPELFGPELEDAPALDDVAAAAADGTPVLGECGGLMALARSLTTADGDRFEMAGALPVDVRMRDRYQALDHVELRARERTVTAAAGDRLRGHEFHYSEADPDPDATYAFDVERGDGIDGERDGLTERRTLGTYAHVHPESGAFDALLARTTTDP